MSQFRLGGFRILPPVIKNLLIINGLCLLAAFTFDFISPTFSLYYMGSEAFRPFQLITYMFLHSTRDFGHILMNMFALWMFGSAIENLWGPKRFLIFYVVAGIGAALVHMVVAYFRLSSLSAQIPPEMLEQIYSEGHNVLARGMNYSDPIYGLFNSVLNTPMVGASGAVFGILLAFGMMFPNSVLYLYFAIPVKAKYFVIGYGILELFWGVSNRAGDNVAHFAHLGGMIFGFFLIRYWKKSGNLY